MPPAFWLGLLLGVSLGVANTLASYLVTRLALRRSPQVFVRLVLGSLVVRQVLVLGIFALLLVLRVGEPTGLVFGLLISFVVGLGVEYALLRPHLPLPTA